MLALAACSSGDSSQMAQAEKPAGSLSPALPPASTADYSGGYLYGDLYLDDGSNSHYPIQVLMSEDGRFRALQAGPYGYPQTYLLLHGSFALAGRFSRRGHCDCRAGETVDGVRDDISIRHWTGHYTSNGKLLYP
jgi:hypothetical protein